MCVKIAFSITVYPTRTVQYSLQGNQNLIHLHIILGKPSWCKRKASPKIFTRTIRLFRKAYLGNGVQASVVQYAIRSKNTGIIG